MVVHLLNCPACGKNVVPEGATKCPSCGFEGTAGSSDPPVVTPAQVNAEIERKRLEDTIAKGVERGVLRALAIYLLITVITAIIVAIVRAS